MRQLSQLIMKTILYKTTPFHFVVVLGYLTTKSLPINYNCKMILIQLFIDLFV